MGDRGNVLVKENSEDPGIYLYTHWSGTELPDIVQGALSRGKGRWGDTPYLTRIIFSDMVREDIDGETGYGIGRYEVSGEHSTIILNDGAQTVTIDDLRWSYSEFSRAGKMGIPLAGDPSAVRAALYKCQCCN